MFDPTLPPNGGPLSSAQMRAQLTSLKALIDAQAAQLTLLQDQLSGLQSLFNSDTAHNPVGFPNSAISFSDPPQTSDLTQIQEYMNNLKNFLARTD